MSIQIRTKKIKIKLEINYISYLSILIIFLLSINFNSLNSREYYIRDVIINQKDVFDNKDKDWFWGASFLNKFHTLTNSFIIEDELLFRSEDGLDLDLIEETERNLRRADIFTWVKIELDSVDSDTYDILVTTQDKWSLQPAILYGTGGGISTYGAKIQEKNLFGNRTELDLEVLYRTENNIGIQGRFEFNQPRLLRTELNLNTIILANKFRNMQSINLFKPYRTLNTTNAYGLNLLNHKGNDFYYLSVFDSVSLIKVDEQSASAYYSKAFLGDDRSFVTFYTNLQQVDRGSQQFRRAYDNSGQMFAAFSSVSEEYIKTNKINTYLDEDLQIGGYGSAVIGRTFSLANGGESMWYIGAEGETSYYTGDLYLFGRAGAGSAFVQNESKYVGQESEGIAFYKLSNQISINSRFKQNTVWRWNALRQLILDTDIGIRGIDANKFSGDNRFFSNTEIRFFPDINWWVLNFSAIAFFDIGTVWNQSQSLTDTKFYKTTGMGLRFHNMKTTGKAHIIRIDFAYNINDNKFGGIVFGTEQYFSSFKWHIFRLPKIIGLDFDEE